ncbi:hypothetical protein [Aliikangiella sp. IMCC44359]|uniref:hypothetical protein n=1 Tax=Aliikangiella sp. IMCC44359 TaxID=3459125 RepID=UPI00403A9926
MEITKLLQGNSLLESLPRKEHKRIIKHCEPVALDFGTVLCKSTQPIKHVYFPLSGFISLIGYF